MKRQLILLSSALLCSTLFSSARAEQVFFEGFEGWNGHREWLPDGWSRISKTPGGVEEDGWYLLHPTPEFGNDPVEGSNYMHIKYSDDHYKDEWLVTPTIHVPVEGVLTFQMWQNYLFWCNLDAEHWDQNSTDFTKQDPSAVMEVWILPNGGEWTILKDFYKDEVEGKTFYKLLLEQMYYGFHEKEVSLKDYVGQDVQIGFRYVGFDGDSIDLDAVRVFTKMVPTDYYVPLSALYWGTACEPGLALPQETVEFYPAYTPLEWERHGADPDASYLWSYMDQKGSVKNATDAKLTIKLLPDFTNESTAVTSIYNTPVLTGSMAGFADGVYTGFGELLQAGGQPIGADGKRYGVLPFDPIHEGLGFLDMYWSNETVPVGGHSRYSDNYWTWYWTGTGDITEENNAQVVGTANLIPAPYSPMVVKGAWLNAYGRIADPDLIELTLTIYKTDNNGQIDMLSPLAWGVCYGEDLLEKDGNITIPFELNREVVMNDMYPLYYVEITGLRSDGFEYIAPYISRVPHKRKATHGWVRYDVVKDGNADIEMGPLNWFVKQGNECNNAFAINLDAEFPYLEMDRKKFHPGRNKEVRIPFLTYYDASDLELDVQGVSCSKSTPKVSLEGRFNKAYIVLEDNCDCEDIHEFTIEVRSKAQVRKMFISEDPNSVATLGADGATIDSLWKIDGTQAKGNELTPGIYIGKYNNGTTKKIIVK